MNNFLSEVIFESGISQKGVSYEGARTKMVFIEVRGWAIMAKSYHKLFKCHYLPVVEPLFTFTLIQISMAEIKKTIGLLKISFTVKGLRLIYLYNTGILI